jgi:DNA-binding Lrp family transcriptional regulator
MVQAYVFINIKAGTAKDVIRKLRKKKFVKRAHLVTGLHDVIAFIEGKNVKELADSITEKIHKVKGIQRSVTCVVVDGK